MHIINPLQQHSARIDAYAQSLKLWLLALAGWLVMMMDSRAGRIQLQHLVIEARQDVRVLIALKMGLRLRVHTGRRFANRHGHCSAPRGFRLQARRGRRLRLFTRGIALRSLRDMQRVLRGIDAVVDRALARLPGRLTGMSVVIRSGGALAAEFCQQRDGGEGAAAPDTS